MKRQMEGDNGQRRAAAREAREQGERPSERSATLGASKQEKQVDSDASHQERVETPREGKANPGPKHQARPGNRDEDPKRSGDWT